MSLMKEQQLACDVLVAGGGMAGVACAVAAARGGSRVILVQDRPVLGGNASSEVRMHVCGADGGRAGDELAVEAREGGIMEEVRLETSVRNPQKSASMLDLILYEKCRGEKNLTLMLNTSVVGTKVEGSAGGPSPQPARGQSPDPLASPGVPGEGEKRRRITQAIAERQSTEDRFVISAKVFVDCTGDGRLGAEAGAAFFMGREEKEAFHEANAQEKADKKTLGSTLLFTARKHDRAMPFVPPPWVRKFTEEDLKLRPHARAGVDQGLEYGYWWVEWGGQLDTIKDNEIIRDELLGIMLGIWDHIKNGGDHGAANWALEWFGFLPGKRESRRFVGQHILNEADILESRTAKDAIAYGGWSIDLHPPEGVDGKDLQPFTPIRVPHLYDVPLRCCVARDIENLMFAGRNISATHVGFASTRVMATCGVIGEGVGTAAAEAVRRGVAPGKLAADAGAMTAIQQRLLKEDCYLVGVANEDELDVARKARVSASSEQERGPARNVISGCSRAVDGERGAPRGRFIPGTNRWMSDEKAGLPAWIELRWDRAIALGELRLVFDSAMHRRLTLSHSADFMAAMTWGRPQEPMVCDYVIRGLVGEEWVELERVEGNYQRLRVHRMAKPARVTAVRIEITKTGGVGHARVCEIRAYEG